MGLFEDIGLGSIGESIDSGFNGISGGASDIFNNSVDLTKNLGNAAGTAATNLASFLNPQTLTIILYVGGALVVYKIAKS